MLGIATDGFYGSGGATVIVSHGGAGGGVPDAPEAVPQEPEILAINVRPTIVSSEEDD